MLLWDCLGRVLPLLQLLYGEAICTSLKQRKGASAKRSRRDLQGWEASVKSGSVV